MTVSTQEAAAALDDVARVHHRSAVLRGYEHGAPHFLLWGVIWLVGYGGTYLYPAAANPLWLVLDVLGIGGSYLFVRAAPRSASPADSARGARFGALALAIAGFIAATYYVLRPHSALQFAAFPPLLMAFAYTAIGVWRGVRWAAIGIMLAVLTVTGYAFLPAYFIAWMAVCGSASLLLTGLWMRRA